MVLTKEVFQTPGKGLSTDSERTHYQILGKNKDTNPFERMLKEMEIKHIYTRPYRPQTNGKIERFWRTIEDELIEGTTFETKEEFKKELEEYLIYYNEYRAHQGNDGKTPKDFTKFLSTN